MSGDVFGNGMLLSDRIRLVAAYDHRHVFIDPDPDPAAGFAERKRLFELHRLELGRLRPRADLRGRRRLAAQPRSRSRSRRRRAPALGVEDERLAPDRRDPRDPARAGRPALERRHRHGRQGVGRDRRRRAGPRVGRDPRRRRATCAAASSARAATSASRAARGSSTPREGGLINADFIDNSAGVDCSDHEVNLKILLGLAERRGELDRPGARRAAARGHRRRRRARALRLVPAGADPRPGGRRSRATRMYAYEDLMAALEAARAARPRRPRGCRAPRRSPSAAAPGAGWSGPSSRCCSPTPSARSPATCSPRTSATTRGSSATCASYFPDRVVERFGHLLRRAPAAARADRDDQREPGRQLARPDVRLPARRRARRRAGRHRARVPDRARGDRRRRRAGTRSSRSRASIDRARRDRADARRRPARRGGDALVPRARRRRAPLEERIARRRGAVRAADRRAAGDRRRRVARAPPRGRPTSSIEQRRARGRRLGARAARPS